MTYHISNLGSFAGSAFNTSDPAYYADLDGFVPQAGDPRPTQARDGDWSEFTDEDWAEWITRAEAATAEAERRAQAWREGNP